VEKGNGKKSNSKDEIASFLAMTDKEQDPESPILSGQASSG
jgi:hypothetical protein